MRPKKLPNSPLFYDYLRKFQEDPSSRVFAPLAEAYRKAGLVDEAIEVAREGLQNHPSFIGGRVALSRALFDKEQYEEVIKELTPIVQDVPDNLVAQRLLAESCLMVGGVAEALGAFKMLLYFSPADPETAKIVHELEDQAYAQGTLVLRSDPPAKATEGFDIRTVGEVIKADPSHLRAQWIKRIEKLQGMLQRVEHYRNDVAG